MIDEEKNLPAKQQNRKKIENLEKWKKEADLLKTARLGELKSIVDLDDMDKEIEKMKKQNEEANRQIVDEVGEKGKGAWDKIKSFF